MEFHLTNVLVAPSVLGEELICTVVYPRKESAKQPQDLESDAVNFSAYSIIDHFDYRPALGITT